FVTLDFFNAIGRNTTGNPRLSAPGKVFPIIHPARDGKAGQARILYAGNASPKARIDISAPLVVRTVVGADRVSEIELQTEPKDDREGLRAADALANLVRLHAAGLYKTELSYDKIDRITIALA